MTRVQDHNCSSKKKRLKELVKAEIGVNAAHLVVGGVLTGLAVWDIQKARAIAGASAGGEAELWAGVGICPALAAGGLVLAAVSAADSFPATQQRPAATAGLVVSAVSCAAVLAFEGLKCFRGRTREGFEWRCFLSVLAVVVAVVGLALSAQKLRDLRHFPPRPP